MVALSRMLAGGYRQWKITRLLYSMAFDAEDVA